MLYISPRLRFVLRATPIQPPDTVVADCYYPQHCSTRFKTLGGGEVLEKRPCNVSAVPIDRSLYALQKVLTLSILFLFGFFFQY